MKKTVDQVEVLAYEIPTDSPEADGTFAWNSTTVIVVRVSGAGARGLGYTYGDRTIAGLIAGTLAGVVEGADAMAVSASWHAMADTLRNTGRPGIGTMAIAAVDTALWDLKARLLDLPLVTLLGAVRDRVPVYGSGGFTSYSPETLQRQLAGWVEGGIGCVKMKVGSEPARDRERVRAAREAIGPEADLFVDANGAYDRKQALAKAAEFQASGVSWFEEPVSSDDLAGLRLIRDRAPPGMEITAGEYGYDAFYFRRMLEAGAVDVLQADATRCAGITGLIHAAALCRAHNIPLSAHTAPSLHAHPGCALKGMRHVEYFHDHVRVEEMIFDGALQAVDGALRPDMSRTGMGLELRETEATRFAV